MACFVPGAPGGRGQRAGGGTEDPAGNGAEQERPIGGGPPPRAGGAPAANGGEGAGAQRHRGRNDSAEGVGGCAGKGTFKEHSRNIQYKEVA
eukprot:9287115-Pyramimonas_sp.AAC.2